MNKEEQKLLADRIVMMTNGPAARIGGILAVPLPRPRKRKHVLDGPTYYPTRDVLLTSLESGIPPGVDGKGRKDEDEAEADRATFFDAH